MKDLKITIKPPITEYCSKCEYEDSYSFTNTRANCPKCGASVYSGIRPNRELITFAKASGKYNLLSDNEQYQYILYNLPKECGRSQQSFVVDDELYDDDNMSPIEILYELKEIYGKYIYTQNKAKIDKILSVVGSDEFIEKQEEVRIEKERLRLESALFELNDLNQCY